MSDIQRDEESNMIWHNNLQAARTRKNMTVKEMADKLGVGVRTVQRHEAGLHPPSLPDLITYAETYGVTVDELLRGRK